MADNASWATVIVALIGVAGTIGAGALGYQSGSKAVDKDYVQIATTILEQKDATPELRKWSVDVLSSLSPVPFGTKLKSELSQDGLVPRYLAQRIDLPKEFTAPCPDLLKGTGRSIDTALAMKIVNEYQRCKLKHEATTNLIVKWNQTVDEFNARKASIR